MHTPLLPLAYVVASAVIAVAIGDTVYIKSLSFLDVSLAFPIAQCSFPVLTMFVAVLVLEESFTWTTGAGAVLVVLGIYLIAVAGKRPGANSVSGGISGKGVILAITAAVTWTIGVATLKKGVIGMDPFVAAAIRIPSAAIVLSLFALTQRRRGTLQFRKYGSRNIALAAAAGILTYGVAAVLYILAIQLIGAGETVLLIATSPLFILPLSVFILKEKPTQYALAGIFICVAGIYLVVI